MTSKGVWGEILEGQVTRTSPHPSLHARQFLKKAKNGILLRFVKMRISSDKNHV
nr:MAG TPA: hypothetical protein [Caudoviricetes sp.]